MSSHVQYLKLFRVLRDDEIVTNGISAEDPSANKTVEDHVAYGSYNTSQYISTSASFNAAVDFARKGRTYTVGSRRIAKIDTEKLGNRVRYTDLTLPSVLYESIPFNDRAQNFARKFEEVIVEGYIPAECIDEIFVV